MQAYPAYWIEVAKYAYADGEDRAMEVIEKMLLQNQDRMISMTDAIIPAWFFSLWNNTYRFRKDEKGGYLIPEDLR